MKKIVLYILLNIFLLELLKELLKLDQLTYNKLTETLSFNQVEKILQFQKKINNWLYLVLPLLMIFKIFLISTRSFWSSGLDIFILPWSFKKMGRFLVEILLSIISMISLFCMSITVWSSLCLVG